MTTISIPHVVPRAISSVGATSGWFMIIRRNCSTARVASSLAGGRSFSAFSKCFIASRKQTYAASPAPRLVRTAATRSPRAPR